MDACEREKVAEQPLAGELAHINRVLFALRQVHQRQITSFGDNFPEPGFGFIPWMAMKLIQDSAANTVGRIAHRLELDPAATTRMLNQLERRGYITRARSTSDRRLVRLDLTEAGREKCTSSTDPILSAWHSVLRGIDCSEVELLVTLLHKLFSAVSDGASHAKSAMTAGTAGWISPLNLADELKEWPVDDGDAEKVDG